MFFICFYFISFNILKGKEPWVPDPSSPFTEPDWVTKQRMEWFECKKRKAKFKQDTMDIAQLEKQKRSAAHQKRIDNEKKRRAKHAQALLDLKKKHSQHFAEKMNDDDTSFCSSTVESSVASSKKRSKTTPAKKVTPKKSKKTPAPHEKTPDSNKVTKYLITPVATNPNVPATISTVASSVSSFGLPPGTICKYDYCV